MDFCPGIFGGGRTAEVSNTFAAMHGLYLEDLAVGMSAMFGKTVTEADIAAFAGVSGDTNPLHLHDGFAHTTRFGQRIAHGMLSGSFISTVVGTKLPGPGSAAGHAPIPARPTQLLRARHRTVPPHLAAGESPAAGPVRRAGRAGPALRCDVRRTVGRRLHRRRAVGRAGRASRRVRLRL